MRKKSFLVAILLYILAYQNIAESKYITDKQIAKKVVKIQRMINRHNYAVAGLTAVGYIQQLSYWLPGLISLSQRLFGDESDNKNIVVAAQKAEKKEEIGFFSGLAHDTHHLFCTPDGWRNMGKFGFYVVTQVGAFFLFQKISQVIDHPDTLRWYVYAYIPYLRTAKMIEKLAQRLQENNFDNEEQRKHYHYLLHQSCIQLVGYGEDMCAYMTYKSSALPTQQKMLAETTARYLINYQNDMFSKIFKILQSETLRYDEITRLMQSYCAEIKYQKKLFFSIEGETSKDSQAL